ncbi:MAG: hypothetical protein NC187_05105 [Candidatus Amulumruptor caecigallinarius]|nr:hypothetical protein [Candidatus Amulumruptor caecigallinarius]MCM1396851.1 hypothetical protein [Candidatus Amulumruptor caecigallinarius]MCM1454205.1 hypothetical protein [bacterium]
MSYASIDTLQMVLSETVFSHTKDSKKAAGRSLGTLVELITYYLLNEWGFICDTAIETSLHEYGNKSISHKVEFTLQPVIGEVTVSVPLTSFPITGAKIAKYTSFFNDDTINSTARVIDKDLVVKNACILSTAPDKKSNVLAVLDSIDDTKVHLTLSRQLRKAYAMVECKRVGVENGAKKGPQTIEKAKQGAYVAMTTSSLQKVWNRDGELCGLIYEGDTPMVLPYRDLLSRMIYSDTQLVRDFTLSIAVVSNHGNWFTSDNQNKELKVLAQSYDWLLFLTDNGLATFITDLLLSPTDEYLPVRNAFLRSYSEDKKHNSFTKSKIDYNAHRLLCRYFHENRADIENWFNVIAPKHGSLEQLKSDIIHLKEKPWTDILI